MDTTPQLLEWIRNTKEFHDLMKTDRYYETLVQEDIYGYGEQELSVIAMNNYKTKIIYSMNTETNNGGKNSYDVCWSGGKLIVKRLWVLLKNPQNFFKKLLTWELVGFRIYPR